MANRAGTQAAPFTSFCARYTSTGATPASHDR